MTRSHRLVVAAAALLAAQLAFAHAHLLNSAPKNGEVLDASPKELRLEFSEPIETGFTKVRLLGPDETEIPVGKLHAVDANPAAIVLPLPALRAGTYKAQWSAMGRDGHRMKGSVAFGVK